VAAARGAAKLRPQRRELAPAPVVKGTWTTPIQIDPFTVPLEDQLALLTACQEAAERALGGGLFPEPSFSWTRETRVFASTEGSLVTQTTHRSDPTIAATGSRGMGGVYWSRLRGVTPSSGGYETALIPNMQEQLKAAAEESVQLSRLPRRLMDVGRYPVVCDGFTAATIFGATVNPALELDRALGEEIAAGPSVLSPPEEILGVPLFSPLLNVTAGRALPTHQAVQWDDEGVETHQYPVIADGRIVDYHTSRITAPALGAWYQQQNQPMRSHGCAVAGGANNTVQVRTPHVTIAPATRAASVEELCKDIQHGLLIRQVFAVSADQQFASGSLQWGLLLEIERGKVVRRATKTGLEFTMKALWKSLGALGGADTVRTVSQDLQKGQPWNPAPSETTAPALLFKEMNVITDGRQV